MTIHEISIGLKELLDILYHPDDLGVISHGASRAIEGIKGHRLIRDRRPADYQTEVPVQYIYRWMDYQLTISGRIDGLRESSDGITVEEIKTTYSPLNGLTPDLYPAHAAQLKLYLYFLSVNYPDKKISGILTYLNLDDLTERSFPFECIASEGKELLDSLAVAYLSAIEERELWRQERNRSLANWAFPFSHPRPGQDELLETVATAIEDEVDLCLEAATGIGKTIGVLYPALKRLAVSRRYDQIFFLTAKTAGKEIIKKTLIHAASQGVRLRTVFIEAKERVCLYPEAECRPDSCPCAAGYFSRVKPAIPYLLQDELILPETVLGYAKNYQLCPFELSLDLSLRADLIVCDYNYIFDPSVYLKRFFMNSGRKDYLFLIDEAHNLVSRGREMYSATLSQARLDTIREALGGTYPEIGRACRRVSDFFKSWHHQLDEEGRKGMLLQKLPEMFEPALEKLIELLEQYFIESSLSQMLKSIREFYFELLRLIRVISYIQPEYAIYVLNEAGQIVLRLFCQNPGPLLRKRLDWARSAIFFSATLSPQDYFRELLGAGPNALSLRLASPFPQENRLYLHIPGVDTRYRNRDSSAEKVAQITVDMVLSRIGNYLVFFPSYTYLNAVRPLIQQKLAGRAELYTQFPAMKDHQKRNFIERVTATGSGRSHLGLAVLGGLFGEGVDLPGEQLVGVMIIGPGLPTISPEQELIQNYFNQRNNSGFLYAYVIPGIIRVIQSAGRVFRTPEDRGVVLLVDDRFLDENYRNLLPPDWFMAGRPFSCEDYQTILKDFWGEG